MRNRNNKMPSIHWACSMHQTSPSSLRARGDMTQPDELRREPEQSPGPQFLLQPQRGRLSQRKGPTEGDPVARCFWGRSGCCLGSQHNYFTQLSWPGPHLESKERGGRNRREICPPSKASCACLRQAPCSAPTWRCGHLGGHWKPHSLPTLVIFYVPHPSSQSFTHNICMCLLSGKGRSRWPNKACGGGRHFSLPSRFFGLIIK